MENKYREAFKILTRDEEYYTDEEKNAWCILDQLIMKEEPKERFFNGKRTYYCPNCHVAVRGRDAYCPACGQKLVGGKER